MLHSDPLEDYDPDEIEAFTNIRNIPDRERHSVQRLRLGAVSKRRPVQASPEMTIQDDTIGSFDFSYDARDMSGCGSSTHKGFFSQWLDDAAPDQAVEANVYLRW
jgi:hypothetical protein